MVRMVQLVLQVFKAREDLMENRVKLVQKVYQVRMVLEVYRGQLEKKAQLVLKVFMEKQGQLVKEVIQELQGLKGCAVKKGKTAFKVERVILVL